MTETRKIVKNADNERLMPWTSNMFVTGYVDEVNGPGASEVVDFVPTRHELIQLARYWAQTLLDNHWWYFSVGQDGSTGWRERQFASLRLGRLACVLGDPEVDRIVDRVWDGFSRRIPDHEKPFWNIFLNGSKEEYEATVGFCVALYHYHDDDSKESAKELLLGQRKVVGGKLSLKVGDRALAGQEALEFLDSHPLEYISNCPIPGTDGLCSRAHLQVGDQVIRPGVTRAQLRQIALANPERRVQLKNRKTGEVERELSGQELIDYLDPLPPEVEQVWSNSHRLQPGEIPPDMPHEYKFLVQEIAVFLYAAGVEHAIGILNAFILKRAGVANIDELAAEQWAKALHLLNEALSSGDTVADGVKAATELVTK